MGGCHPRKGRPQGMRSAPPSGKEDERQLQDCNPGSLAFHTCLALDLVVGLQARIIAGRTNAARFAATKPHWS